MTQSIEIELKYRASDAVAPEVLAATQIGPFRLGAFERVAVKDTYFETSDRAFAAAGFAFRFRQGQGEEAVTLKGLQAPEGDVHRRSELTAATAQPQRPQTWPAGPAREVALRVLQERKLQALFSVDQVRHVAPLFHGQDEVAKLSLDQVRWRAGDHDEGAWVLEVELSAAGGEALLDELAAALRERWPLQPEAVSKYERGLALVDAQRKRGIHFALDEPVYSLMARIVAEQGAKLQGQYEGVLDGGDPEAVHDARVAGRRMRSALYFFMPWLPRKPARRLRKRLREAGAALGGVRDLDVILMYVGEHAARMAPGAEAPLRTYLSDRRAAARAAMLAYLGGDRYARLLATQHAFVAAAPPPKPALRQVLPGLLRAAAANVQRYEETLAHAPIAHLHELRISIKRFRYLLEFTRHLTSPTAELLIQPLVAMQDHLGDLHDADVNYHLTYALLRDPDVALAPAERQALLAYGRALHGLIEGQRQAFAPLWQSWTSGATDERLRAVLRLVGNAGAS